MIPATASLIFTSAIGPSSGVAIFINIKALPQIAARVVSKNQSLESTKYISLIKVDEF